MNRVVWILIVGFPADLRNSQEINHDTLSFGKFLVWDRVKTTDATIVIKVRVVALEDISASVLVSGANNPMGESWTCPIVIIQDHLLGGPAADEEPIPDNGNPHPRPDEDFHHPNQGIVVGPAAFHLVQENEEEIE